jgi:hypothetical protein
MDIRRHPRPIPPQQLLFNRVGHTQQATPTSTISPTEPQMPPTPTPTLRPHMQGADGMTLLYVSAGEFIMGTSNTFPEGIKEILFRKLMRS